MTPPSWVNAPPSVVWTKKLQAFAGLHRADQRIGDQRAAGTGHRDGLRREDLAGGIGARRRRIVGLDPEAALRKNIKRSSASGLDVSRRGTRRPGKAVRDDRVAAEGERLVDAAHAAHSRDGPACGDWG